MSYSKKKLNQINIWPGFVDVLATLLIVTIFTIMISSITQIYFNDVLSKKKIQITKLDEEIIKIGDLLSMEKKENLSLEEKNKILDVSIKNLSKKILFLESEEKKKELEIKLNLNKISLLNENNENLTKNLENKKNQNILLNNSIEKNKKEMNKNLISIKNLENNIVKLNKQISQLSDLLSESEKRDKKNKVVIKNLGKKLNLALAGKVQELSNYQSIFLRKIKESLANRSDVIISGDRFIFPSEIFFESANDQLGVNGNLELKKIAKSLREVAQIIPKDIDWVLRIDGHTDKRPIFNQKFSSNWHLSSSRAINIVNFLIDEGVSPKRLVAAGFGEYSPILDLNTEEAFRKNRRIEIKLTNR